MTRSNRETQKYTPTTGVMGERVSDMKSIPSSPITIKTCFMIQIGTVAVIFRPTYTYSLIITWVMRGKVAGMVPISTSTINIKN